MAQIAKVTLFREAGTLTARSKRNLSTHFRRGGESASRPIPNQHLQRGPFMPKGREVLQRLPDRDVEVRVVDLAVGNSQAGKSRRAFAPS